MVSRLKFLGSYNPPASISRAARTTGVYHKPDCHCSLWAFVVINFWPRFSLIGRCCTLQAFWVREILPSFMVRDEQKGQPCGSAPGLSPLTCPPGLVLLNVLPVLWLLPSQRKILSHAFTQALRNHQWLMSNACAFTLTHLSHRQVMKDKRAAL
jgi:hypothetical protein